jgi:hypothetical protein
MLGVTPIFDLTRQGVDCVSQIGVEAVGISLAPVVNEIELRGGLFGSDWTASLKEAGIGSVSGTLNTGETTRKFRLCSGTGIDDKRLMLGAHPRPPAASEPARPKKRAKRPSR